MEELSSSVGRLNRVPIRNVWNDEANAFTPWLRDNIEVLGETLDIELSAEERETKIGDFEADILAEDSSGDRVVIENQFGKSDHDHLGKAFTYFANIGAKTLVWICEEPRQEHIEAVEWLNKARSDVSFYLVKVDAFRIGDSDPAPLFTVISGPSEESRSIGETEEELAERHIRRLEFWRQLLSRSEGRLDLFANVSPSKENWISAGSGKSGLHYVFVVKMRSARVELYFGRATKDENKKLFDALYGKREQIESVFGGPLDWQRLSDRKASRIAKIFEGIGLKDEEKWGELRDKLIDAMIGLRRALQDHIRGL